MPSIISIPLTGTITSGPMSNSPCCSVHVLEHARIALVQQSGGEALSLAYALDLRRHRLHPRLDSLQPRNDVGDWQLCLVFLCAITATQVHDTHRQHRGHRHEADPTDECCKYILVHDQVSVIKASIGRVNSILVPVPTSLCADTEPSCAHTA